MSLKTRRIEPRNGEYAPFEITFRSVPDAIREDWLCTINIGVCSLEEIEAKWLPHLCRLIVGWTLLVPVKVVSFRKLPFLALMDIYHVLFIEKGE